MSGFRCPFISRLLRFHQVKEEELAQIRQEVAKQIKMRLAVQKKIHQMEDQKAELDVQTETLKAQIAALEKGLEFFFLRNMDVYISVDVSWTVHFINQFIN